MKFSTILIVGLIILMSLTSYSEASVLENEHYIICGHIYEPYTHSTATLENIRTTEVQSVETIDCEHSNMKGYLFNLANFKQGWVHVDSFIIRYGNQSTTIKPVMTDIGIQADFNRPSNIEPMAVITGTILILSSSGLYYRMRRKSNMSENTNPPEKTAEDEQPEFIPYFDRIFGGTKRGWIMVTSLFLFAALAAGITIPDELMKIYQIVIGMWFSVGGLNAVRTVGN